MRDIRIYADDLTEAEVLAVYKSSRLGPLHHWAMTETSGTTFADAGIDTVETWTESAPSLWSGSSQMTYSGSDIGAPSSHDEAIYTTAAIPSSSFPLEISYTTHSAGATLDNSDYCMGLFDSV